MRVQRYTIYRYTGARFETQIATSSECCLENDRVDRWMDHHAISVALIASSNLPDHAPQARGHTVHEEFAHILRKRPEGKIMDA